MITRNELKYYSSLTQKKFRNEEKKFIVEGEKNVLEGLKSNYKTEMVFITHEFSEDNPDLTQYAGARTRLEIIKNAEFNKLSDTVNPQGICAVFSMQQEALTADKLKNKLIVVLDNISDPGNTGTIIRTCDWFGVNEIILSKGCAEIYNPKTLRASMGSVFHMKIFDNTDLIKAAEIIRKAGYKLCCTDLSGENIFNYSFPVKVAVVFSNEANGPSEIIKRFSDIQITIPGTGKAESLNVAAAAGIVLAEISREKYLS